MEKAYQFWLFWDNVKKLLPDEQGSLHFVKFLALEHIFSNKIFFNKDILLNAIAYTAAKLCCRNYKLSMETMEKLMSINKKVATPKIKLKKNRYGT